jgi:hypothetical protein
MNVVVSISDFRNNLSDYIDLIGKGDREVLVKDKKKDEVVGVFSIPKKEKFNWDEYIKFVKSLAGSGLLAGRKDEEARKRFRDSFNERFEETRNR